MGRKANDGRGRLGGRAKETPNKKDAPLKTLLRDHSLEYFKKNEDGLSAFDRDVLKLEPRDRVNAELSMLHYHTSQMKAVDVDMSVSDGEGSFAQRLAQLNKDD